MFPSANKIPLDKIFDLMQLGKLANFSVFEYNIPNMVGIFIG
jgi:hypothetical protein